MPPSELCQYWSAHQYQGPGCLCPLLAPLSQKRVFTEAAIYLTILGLYKGEYVAQCAKSRCGYLGQSSPPLEKWQLTSQWIVFYRNPVVHVHPL